MIMNLLYMVVFGINAPKLIAPDQLPEEQVILSLLSLSTHFILRKVNSSSFSRNF